MLDLPFIHGHTGMALLAGIVVTLFIGLAGFLSVRWSRGKSENPFSPEGEQEPEGKITDPFVMGSKREKRRHYRRRGNESQILIKTDQLTFPGCVVDRSASGLALEADRKVELGSILHIRPGQASELFPWVRVEVRTCRQIHEGWLFGVRYLDDLPYGTLLAFG